MTEPKVMVTAPVPLPSASPRTVTLPLVERMAPVALNLTLLSANTSTVPLTERTVALMSMSAVAPPGSGAARLASSEIVALLV